MAAKPPPLPPRNPSRAYTSDLHFDDSADEYSANPNSTYLSPNSSRSSSPPPYFRGLQDPRSSSTQSLRPVESAGYNRRTLLLVYIHGFLGDETSFKSFPAHVHGLLTKALKETHVVYSKIYPQYKSRKNISFARDGFSNWSVIYKGSPARPID